MNGRIFSPQKSFQHIETVQSGTLVVYIHGITEGPEQFRELIDYTTSLHNDSVALVLPGHGGSAMDFSRSNGTEWRNYVNAQLDTFRKQYKRIFIVGHSMGGLLAINTYCYNPQSIVGIVTIGCPIYVWVTARAVHNLLGFRYFPTDTNEEHVTLQNVINVAPGPTLEYRHWIPRIKDLFMLIDDTRKNLPAIHIPLLAIQGMQDELVDARHSLSYFTEHTDRNCLSTLKLTESTHLRYSDNDKKTMEEAILSFINTHDKP